MDDRARTTERRARRRRSAAHRGGAVVLAVASLAGCALGERPTLVASTSTGDAGVDELLERIAGIDEAVYTAVYDVYVPFDDQTVEVSTTQAAADRRSMTVGDVRFLVDRGNPETCTLSTGQCEPGHDAARVSDVQLTNDFFGTSLASRLRRDAATAVGPITASDETFAGTAARCVSIPLPGAPATPEQRSSGRYCVFDNGVLALLDGSDIRVTLTAYASDADLDQLTRRE